MSPVGIRTSRSTSPLETGSAKLWLILVGVNQYQDPQLPCLRFSALDCQGLAVALSEATQGFPRKEVMIFHDFAELEPELEAVRGSLKAIANSAKPQDTVLFYFSGHGIIEENSQQVVLCLQDTQKENLTNTGLPLLELLQLLEKCSAQQQLVWLDACHSGGMTLLGARGNTTEEEKSNPTPQLVELLRQRAARSKGFYALLSCDQQQLSWEFPELGHGLFTYYLMRGLRGEAADAQGVIEADGLYRYVYHQTLSYIDKINQQLRLINQQNRSRGLTQVYSEYQLQTPKRIVEGVGELILGLKSSQGVKSQPKRKALMIEGVAEKKNCLEIRKILADAGGFEVNYLFQPETAKDVRDAIANLLQSESTSTVLLYVRSRVEKTEQGLTLLELSPTVKMTSSWLKKQLRTSNAQQIAIVETVHVQSPPHVSETRHVTSLQQQQQQQQHWVEDLQLSLDKGQCVIAATAPTQKLEEVFTTALHKILNKNRSGLTAAAWITQLQLELAPRDIQLYFWLSGTQGIIEVIPEKTLFTNSVTNSQASEYFLADEYGANYNKLRDLLKNQQWRLADEETTNIILRITHQEQQGYIKSEHIEKLPDTDLHAIDSLWIKYSNGRFGFSVQKRILQNVKVTKAGDKILAAIYGQDLVIDGETCLDFANRVGWRLQDSWLNYDRLKFSLDAPEGHLPFCGFFNPVWRIDVLGIWELNSMIALARWWRGYVSLFSSIKSR